MNKGGWQAVIVANTNIIQTEPISCGWLGRWGQQWLLQGLQMSRSEQENDYKFQGNKSHSLTARVHVTVTGWLVTTYRFCISWQLCQTVTTNKRKIFFKALCDPVHQSFTVLYQQDRILESGLIVLLPSASTSSSSSAVCSSLAA